MCFDYLVLQDEKIERGKLNKKINTQFKELQKTMKGKENKTMAFPKNQDDHFYIKKVETFGF